jgi:hypothetical protein
MKVLCKMSVNNPNPWHSLCVHARKVRAQSAENRHFINLARVMLSDGHQPEATIRHRFQGVSIMQLLRSIAGRASAAVAALALSLALIGQTVETPAATTQGSTPAVEIA